MKHYLTVAVLALTALLVSCGLSSRSSSLTSEANQEAEKYWNSVMSKCGDSYYGIRKEGNFSEGTLYQFKEPQITFKEQKVSDAERLNGLEYAGTTTVTYKAFRTNWRGQWSDWRQPWTFGGVSADLNEDVRKQSGKWFIGNNPEQPPQRWQKIDCSEVPQ